MQPETIPPGTDLTVQVTLLADSQGVQGGHFQPIIHAKGITAPDSAWRELGFPLGEASSAGNIAVNLAPNERTTITLVFPLSTWGVADGEMVGWNDHWPTQWWNSPQTRVLMDAPTAPPTALPLIGLLGDEMLMHLASEIVTLGGDGTHGGLELRSSGDVGTLGATTVVVSAAWDWSVRTALHPCALVDVWPATRTFPVDIATSFDPTPWTVTATVTVATASGAVSGSVVGGSVCELEAVAPPPGESRGGSLLEGIISFELTGGSGDLSGASGSGHIRLIANSVTREITGNELLLRLD